MQGIIPTDHVLYAVIQTIYSNGDSERLVVAYATARSLRDFIASERIVAYGFQSKSEAAQFALRPDAAVPLRRRVSQRLNGGRRSFARLAHSIASMLPRPYAPRMALVSARTDECRSW